MKKTTRRITTLLVSGVTALSALSLSGMAAYATPQYNLPEPENTVSDIDVEVEKEGTDGVAKNLTDIFIGAEITNENGDIKVNGKIEKPRHEGYEAFGIWEETYYFDELYEYRKYNYEKQCYENCKLDKTAIFYEITESKTKGKHDIYFYGEGFLAPHHEITNKYGDDYFENVFIDGEDIIVVSTGINALNVYNKNCIFYSEDMGDAEDVVVRPPLEFGTTDVGTVIYGYSGSTAEQYANKHGNIFVAFDSEDTTTTTSATTATTTKSATAAPASTTTTATTAKSTTATAASTTTTATTAKSTTTTPVTTTTTVTTSTETKPANILYGDANCDGSVELNDAILIMQALANPAKYGINGTAQIHITKQGWINADCYNTGDDLTLMDALTIQKYKLGLISSLPDIRK